MRWMWRRSEEPRKPAPAKYGLLAFFGFCMAVLIWDVSTDGGNAALLADPQPVSGEVELLPEDAPAPEEAPPDAEDAEAQAEARAQLFAAYRLDRESAREEELALLEDIIADEGGSVAIRQEAEERRLQIAKDVENEARAESILDAKGMGETVVLMGEDQATVICAVEMNAALATRMAQIVAEACQVDFENVVIVNR